MDVLRKNRVMLLILVFALALRLFVLFTEGDTMYLGTDDDNYRESAETLLKNGILTYAGWKEPTVFIMPGYPLFLAGVFAAAGSVSWPAARLCQVFISLLIVWLMVKLGISMGRRRTGILSGLLGAVYPPNLTAPCFLMTEVIFTGFLLAVLYLFLETDRNGQGGAGQTMGWVLTGITLGLSVYFRPTSGVLPAVFGIYLLFRGYPLKRVFYCVGIIVMVMLILLSPWIIRNHIIYKEFIPFTVSGGNPFLRGTYIDEKIDEKFPWVEGPRILSDKAQMEYGKTRFIEGFRNDFGAYLHWYTVDKFKDFWGGPYYYKQLTCLPQSRVKQLHLLILLTGAAGLVIGLWRRSPAALLFLLVCGYFSLLHMVYLTGPRYSYPLMQLSIITAAYLFMEGFSILTRKYKIVRWNKNK